MQQQRLDSFVAWPDQRMPSMSGLAAQHFCPIRRADLKSELHHGHIGHGRHIGH